MNQRLVWNFEFTQPAELLELPAATREEIKWETRLFWTNDQIVKLHNIDPELLTLANYEQKIKEDIYYLLSDQNLNIKFRNDVLVYKPILKQLPNAIGFGAKEFADPDLQKTGKPVLVKKHSFYYQFSVKPKIKLELSQLEINNQLYLSACVEGRSLALVETISRHLFQQESTNDYVTFLKKIIKL